MAKGIKDKEITYDVDEEFDYILEETGNTSTNLRKVSWNGRPSKIDIRKWSYQEPGKERAMKGITLSDKATDELVNILVENNYGDTARIRKAISERDDFDSDGETDESNDDEEESYYDPSELFS